MIDKHKQEIKEILEKEFGCPVTIADDNTFKIHNDNDAPNIVKNFASFDVPKIVWKPTGEEFVSKVNTLHPKLKQQLKINNEDKTMIDAWTKEDEQLLQTLKKKRHQSRGQVVHVAHDIHNAFDVSIATDIMIEKASEIRKILEPFDSRL